MAVWTQINRVRKQIVGEEKELRVEQMGRDLGLLGVSRDPGLRSQPRRRLTSLNRRQSIGKESSAIQSSRTRSSTPSLTRGSSAVRIGLRRRDQGVLGETFVPRAEFHMGRQEKECGETSDGILTR